MPMCAGGDSRSTGYLYAVTQIFRQAWGIMENLFQRPLVPHMPNEQNTLLLKYVNMIIPATKMLKHRI